LLAFLDLEFSLAVALTVIEQAFLGASVHRTLLQLILLRLCALFITDEFELLGQFAELAALHTFALREVNLEPIRTLLHVVVLLLLLQQLIPLKIPLELLFQHTHHRL